MTSEYQQMLRDVERKAYSSSVTKGVVALAVISLLLLGVAFVCLLQKTGECPLAINIICLVGGLLALFGSVGWYVLKAREYMRVESIQLDLTHPGFYDTYHQWQAKIDEINSKASDFDF